MAELTNPHDKFFKEALTQPDAARIFLRDYLPAEVTAQLDLARLQLVKDDALAATESGPLAGIGFQVRVGGGMGRTPIIGSVIREFLPWHQVMNYLEAVIRVYNGYGRRDNVWKARIKILVKAEGQR